ncbi:MAG TPA: hypothetical protein VFF67_08590 [Thermoplasmata archaeon]|nr:hypothetical protein [Thermoplasmata archaeon]
MAIPTIPPRRFSPSGESAETMALIAFIFQCLASAFVFLIAGFFPFFFLAGLFGAFFAALLIVLVAATAFTLYAGYAWVYARIQRGEYQAAQAPALVLGILGLIFGGVIVGVFYIVAYVKLGDAAREALWPGYGWYGPGTTAPLYPMMPSPPPPPPPSTSGGTAPTCAKCGRPTAFIVAYGRYYCYTDQLYV